jgi:NADPH-dependent ferric siderophore reductase
MSVPKGLSLATYLTVTEKEHITPSILRLWFHSDDLSAFADSDQTDRYVKLVFPKEGVDYPDPIDMRELRRTMAAEDLPLVRTYTALFPDVQKGTMAIDFVIHGDHGVAGPWAVAAQPGDQLVVNGPGGDYRPDPDADWHLLVGDEAAVPAITAALHVLPEDAVTRVVVQVDGPEHEPGLPLPGSGEIVYVHRSDTGQTGGLVDAVRDLEWPEGRVHAFVHGEATEVMQELRPYLLNERKIPREDISISGYWRRGDTEEGFRSWKARSGGSGRGRRS